MGVVFGIDLTLEEVKPSACVGLDDTLELIYFGLLFRDRDIFSIGNFCLPQDIAIDAPLSLPLGLCCLEDSCSCLSLGEIKGRQCERELAKEGIPCYFTTKRSIIKKMVYRAIRLKEQFTQADHKVIEVYPYASKVRLFGKALPSKGTKNGLTFLRQKLGRTIPSFVKHLDELDADLCDAAIAAYTAFLYRRGKTEAVGNPEEGLIHIPKL